MKIKKSQIALIASGLMMTGIASCANKAESASETKQSAETVETVVEEPVAAADTDPAADEDYITTPSGLKYKVIKEGTGKQPAATDIVKVNYEGKFTDGKIFDSSYQRNEPATFPLNRVIAGWTEGLQLMKEGAVYEFYIPYNLAYGEQGNPPVIPPKSDLTFTVELLEVQ